MAEPRIQNEPATEPIEEPEGITDAYLEDLREKDPEDLTAAERRALRGPREKKAPRLRRDLFGSAGGVK